MIFVLVLVTLMLPFQVNLVPLFLFLSDLHWLNSSAALPRASRRRACASRPDAIVA